MMPTPIKVLCVEDNALVADAMARKLKDNPDFIWLGWVSTSAELFQKVAEHSPDVICMDLDIPGENAFDMIEALRTRSPASRVMLLSGHCNQSLVEKARSAGAWGYVSKAEESRLIVESIKRIAGGAMAFGRFGDVAGKVPKPTDRAAAALATEIQTPGVPAKKKGRLSFFGLLNKSAE